MHIVIYEMCVVELKFLENTNCSNVYYYSALADEEFWISKHFQNEIFNKVLKYKFQNAENHFSEHKLGCFTNRV